MKKDYTHISIILDRTGSMQEIRDDTIGGFNAFLKDQKDQLGTVTLTLVQFDSQDPYEKIHSFKPLHEVPELTRETFIPRASTPLLDAMGHGIIDLEHSLAKLPDDQQPSKVVLMIITDGQENSSREFRKEQIAKMIQKKQEQNQWQIVFLSADLDGIEDAQQYGIRPQSSMSFDKSAQGTRSAWDSSSEAIRRHRESLDSSAEIEFTKEDRQKQRSEEARKKPKP